MGFDQIITTNKIRNIVVGFVLAPLGEIDQATLSRVILVNLNVIPCLTGPVDDRGITKRQPRVYSDLSTFVWFEQLTLEFVYGSHAVGPSFPMHASDGHVGINSAKRQKALQLIMDLYAVSAK